MSCPSTFFFKFLQIGTNATLLFYISFFLLFLMLPKPKVAFFFPLYFATLQYLCVGFFFVCFLYFKRDSTVYVYKLNEDIILYKCSSESIESCRHSVLARLQHRSSHASDCAQGRLGKQCGFVDHPSRSPESSEQKKKRLTS